MKKSVYLVLAASMLAVLVMPIAFAGAAGNSGGSANASLKKQLKGLKQRLAALEAKQDPVVPPFPNALPPNGPAGGDFTGTFPNPTIKSGAVNGLKLADKSVGSEELVDGGVTSADIAEEGVKDPDMGLDSVGAYALKGVTAVVGGGVGIADDTAGTATVTCPNATMLIAGGYAWNEAEQNSIIVSAPSESDPNQTWVVEGIPHAGSNTLYAWATCIAV